MTILDLVTKVECLTDPCRDTDAAIWFALGACPHTETKSEGYQDDTGHTCVACGADSWGNKNSFGQKLYDRAPAYTASLDAAMEIIPDEMTFYVDSGTGLGAGCHACVWNPLERAHTGGAREMAAPALALCLAALRARASALTGKDGSAAS